MANRERYEEAIRLYVETSGDKELARLVDSLGDVGDAADLQANLARKAMERFAQSIEDLSRVDAFTQLKRDLAETEDKLKQAQTGAQALFREFAAGDTSSPQIVRAQRDARKAVADLEAAAQRQRVELQRLRGELSASGVDTRRLGTAQGELRRQMADARAALATTAQTVQRFRNESRSAAAQVPADNREIARSYSLIERGAGRLRGILAGVAGYLGLREAAQGIRNLVDVAAQGIRNLVDVAAQAENARRALQNLYGGQEKGNRAFDALKGIARQNGVAFNDLVETAKKLKSFGLDPLNGSLQALIDQNAAVGGSMQDLDGKVLALGQAWAKQKLQGEEILQLVERGVPVWDLLQKATGKNVSELQKLSEAGKLGRDTIKGLIDEIGRANSGAASAGLSSLSGLMAQVSARWQEFLNKVADSGVTDYFKRQLQSLLASAGSMDALAKRVAEGIVSTIEALRRFGQQILLVAKPIADATLAIAQYANVLLALGKVYAGLKLLKWANEFRAVEVAQQRTAVAVDQLRFAARQSEAAITGLGQRLSSLPKQVQIGLLIVGIDYALNSVVQLNDAIDQYQQMQDRVAAHQRIQSELQQEQILLGRQQQDLYKGFAGTVIQTATQIKALTQDQASSYRFALEQARTYYGGVIREARATGDAQREAAAREKWDALGAALAAVRDQLKQLDAEAAKQQGLHKLAIDAVAKFDDLIAKGKQAKSAISGVFEGIDFQMPDAFVNALTILEKVKNRGEEAAKAVKAELGQALEAVALEDFPKLSAAAQDAFSKGSAAAKEFSLAVDSVRAKKLGVDLEAIKTGMTAAGREVVTAFDQMVRSIDSLGLTAEQKSMAIAQAFDNAFKQASTKAEIQSLKQALQDALSSGDIGFKEFHQRVTETDTKLAELAGTGKQMGQAVSEGAQQAAQSLDQVGTAAESAASGTDKAAASAEGSKDSFEIGGKAGKEYALVLGDISQKAIDMFSAVTQAQTGIGDSARRFAEGVRTVRGRISEQADQVARLTKEYQAAAEADDEWARRRAALAQRFDLLGDDSINRLVQAEKAAAAVQKQRLEAAERAREKDRAEGDTPGQVIQVARATQQEAAGAAEAVSKVLASAKEAAGALSTASSQLVKGGEITIRIVTEVPPGALAFNLSPQQIDYLVRVMLERLNQSRRSST